MLSCPNAVNATASVTYLFGALVECLVGMKISTINQTEGLCISSVHQSSGYSFSLKWINKAAGDESEFLYRISTLGAFERVVPEWMTDVIMFSTNMCPIFFERVAVLSNCSAKVFCFPYCCLRK